ncbi:SCO-spondin-like [Sycon ciliatum]|uniref:SCO-spondin-like n=1 Tax=Sycon ciliatum TaxID=27933 RepID=UPI0031F6D104
MAWFARNRESLPALLLLVLTAAVAVVRAQDFVGVGDPAALLPPPASNAEVGQDVGADSKLLDALAAACRNQEGSDICPVDSNFCLSDGQCGAGQLCTCVRGCHQLLCQTFKPEDSCPRHPIPVHGYVIDKHASVEFHCGDAHRLIGPRNKTCISGLWRPLNDFPKCKILKCEDHPAAPENGFVVFSPPGRTRRAGTRAEFSCRTGYSLQGNSDIRCTKHNGQAVWTGKAATCRRDGGWGDWLGWTPCSISCQEKPEDVGVQERQRPCNNPEPESGGKPCVGQSVEVRECRPNTICEIERLLEQVPVVWDDWSNCSAECGMGERYRTRNCSMADSYLGGEECNWNETQTQSCMEAPCPVDGIWSDWTPWTVCSSTCGLGTFSRSRSCDNPVPMYGGLNCTGLGIQVGQCLDAHCPVHGGWSEWENISDCSQTCGFGILIQRRDCNNPTPIHGGRYCPGPHQLVEPCRRKPCSVDGGWSDWLPLVVGCSKTCGDGQRVMFRTCTNPVPSNGGRPCDGPQLLTRTCSTNISCPVHGGWSEWNTSSSCSVTCGTGFGEEMRTCTAPSPSFGGDSCRGESTRLQLCSSEQPCPVNGRWFAWKAWTECSVSCGSGTQQRHRDCSAPSNGGLVCVGAAQEQRECNVQQCPVHGNWSEWKDWSDCSVTCGSGVRSRSRDCSSPSPRFGGYPCSGSSEEVKICNVQPCPVHGDWSVWEDWSDCSVSCGADGGIQSKRRHCNNPYPQNGGTPCPGPAVEIRDCTTQVPCPIDGGWTNWTEWSHCSETCGVQGFKLRYRNCTNPAPQHDGRLCPGSSQRIKHCTEPPCAVDGYWHSWGRWSPCDALCGQGLKSRSRTCQPPEHGGQPCAGSNYQTALCTSSVPCKTEVHLGCSAAQPGTGKMTKIAFEHPLLRSVHRCAQRCRQHLTNYVITHGDSACYCVNNYHHHALSHCTRDNFHVYKGLTGKACSIRKLKIQPFQVTVSVSVQQRFTTKCGFIYWRRCTRYRTITRYRRETRYKQVYHIVPC